VTAQAGSRLVRSVTTVLNIDNQMNYWRAWMGSGYETEVLLRFGVI